MSNFNESSQTLLEEIQLHLNQAKQNKQIPLIVIMGPTASGKTALGIALARYFDGEIISADSRQVYKEMDIGTAKPSSEELKLAKHYLIDEYFPHQNFSLADFKKQAEHLIKQINIKEKIPFLVGGTGLYISSITQNYQLTEAAPNPMLREKLEELAEKEGKAAVHDFLKELNPDLAEEIHPNNLRYVIRAIEKLSVSQNAANNLTNTSQTNLAPFFIMIDWPRDELYQMIENRIDQQLQNGLVEETKYLLDKYSLELPAMSSLGYKEISAYLTDQISYEVAINLFKQNTRNYAKRQLTWFRRFKNVYSIPGAELKTILSEISQKTA